MVNLILLGILSGLFFSSTFVLNEIMSLSGGHWVWSASLRYFFMLLFLFVILLLQGGTARIRDILALFLAYWKFWLLSGSVGFGGFYALLCFSADYSPGWVIAATWQFTLVASLFVFILFGHSFAKRVWIFSLLIFAGVCLVNFSHIDTFSLQALILGGLPVLMASFCYPLGNQLVWEAHHGGHSRVPHINSPLLANTFNKIMLLSLGSLPVWGGLILYLQPPLPGAVQVFNSALVALLSGVLATSIFLFARNKAKNSNQLAGVDATQASEVVFALIGSLLFLQVATPNFLSLIGLLMIFAGLFLFIKQQKV